MKSGVGGRVCEGGWGTVGSRCRCRCGEGGWERGLTGEAGVGRQEERETHGEALVTLKSNMDAVADRCRPSPARAAAVSACASPLRRPEMAPACA